MTDQISGDVEAAAAAVRERTSITPRLGLVLGSGLGSLAELVTDPDVIPTTELPGFPASTVEGHDGRLVFGVLERTPVVFFQGRVHLYEGHPIERIVFAVQLLAALGTRRLLVTNAAGGIRPDFPPGTLMWIRNHIDWSFEPVSRSRRPQQRAGDSRSGSPYDLDWLHAAQASADDLGIPTEAGVYIWTRGPSYETPAEIRAFRTLGADAVGMSTVPEVREASRLGMSVLGLSTITNPAAGIGSEPLNHEEVLETGRQVRADLERLVLRLVRDLPDA